VHWPATPVEHLAGFQPAFCPHRDCTEHRRRTPGYLFRHHGSFSTRRRRRVPRYLCLCCRRTFSRQSFAVSYFRKRPELIRPVAAGLVAGSAHRQIARSVGCAPSTVSRLAARLGRHAILLLARAHAKLTASIAEPFVLDHFETFEFTQDYPFGVATVVGAESWFVYALDPAPHGRSGRLSPRQAERLAVRPKREARGGYLQSTRRALDRLLELAPEDRRVVVRGDGHAAYRAAVRVHPGRERIQLEAHPNPPRGPKSSPPTEAMRVRDAAMFPVDLLHKLVRHTMAHHRRETIAFGRRLNAVMERLALAAAWRNFVKRRSERRSTARSPAMVVGLAGEPWSWKRVFSRRLFFDRDTPREPWPGLYRREWTTPLLVSNTRHDRKLAF